MVKHPRRSKRPVKRNARPAPTQQSTSSEDAIEVEGLVVEQLRNAVFRVNIGGENIVMAHTAGKGHTLSHMRIWPRCQAARWTITPPRVPGRLASY